MCKVVLGLTVNRIAKWVKAACRQKGCRIRSLIAHFVENKCFIFVLYLLKNVSTCKTALLSKLTKTCCLNHSSVCRVVGKGSSRKAVSLSNIWKPFIVVLSNLRSCLLVKQLPWSSLLLGWLWIVLPSWVIWFDVKLRVLNLYFLALSHHQELWIFPLPCRSRNSPQGDYTFSVFTTMCLLRASASCYHPIVEFHSSGTSNNRNMQLLLPSFGFLGGREQTACLSPAKWLTRTGGFGRQARWGFHTASNADK